MRIKIDSLIFGLYKMGTHGGYTKREDKREKCRCLNGKRKGKEHADKNEVSKAEYMATAIGKQIERDEQKHK